MPPLVLHRLWSMLPKRRPRLGLQWQTTLVFTAILLLSVGILMTASYRLLYQREIARIDAQLQVAALGLDHLLGADFADRHTTAQSLEQAAYEALAARINPFVQEIGITYLYTLILDGDSARFINDAMPPEDIATGDVTTFWMGYADAPPAVYEAFRTHTSTSADYSDEWGHFHSVFVPRTSPGGRTYVIGADQDLSAVHASLRRLLWHLVLLGLGIGTVAAGFVFAAARTVASPLTTLKRVMEGFAASSFAITDSVRKDLETIEAHGQEEVRHLANSFLNLTVQVRDTLDHAQAQQAYQTEHITHLLAQIRRLADGELALDLHTDSDDIFGHLYRGFEEALTEMHTVLCYVAGAVETTSTAAAEIRTLAERLATHTHASRVQAADVARAVTTVNQGISQTAAGAQQTAEAARRSGQGAEEGNRVVQQTVGKIRDIATLVGVSTHSVERLQAASLEIGHIVGAIQEIARQTNLLALNATIEAARAGAAGRGFAVVADEVRQLALRTDEATRQIGTMIERIQAETGHVVQSMTAGAHEVEAGIGLADAAGQALVHIVTESGALARLNEEMAQDSSTQAHHIESIAVMVGDISRVSDEAARNVTEVAAATEELGSLTEELRRIIQRFKLHPTTSPVAADGWNRAPEAPWP